MRKDGKQKRALVWFLTSAGTAAACALLRRKIHEGDTAEADVKAREKILESSGRRTKKAADVTGRAGKWYVHLPFALATAVKLQREERTAGALAVTASSLAARAGSEVLDRVFDHRTPPPGRGDPSVQSYPSGHALEPLAVALTSSVVLAREGLASPWLVVPAALGVVVSAASRLALDRHWVSDLAGGTLAGVALGSACLGFYELARD